MKETLLLAFFAAGALAGAVLMLFLREPMRVALALVATMLSLAGIYGMLGVHVIAVFQVMIYVGAVMVFMVYAIMLLDRRDSSVLTRFTPLIVPALAAAAWLVWTLANAIGGSTSAPAGGDAMFGVAAFSSSFLADYWLHFELSSVLLIVAVVAALAVIRTAGGRRE
ncbi:MAG: NADH-quinone oxidoreductase subunit J [Steroidobacteraceae bacterium]|nr:NADH-quinone oxidoreductase subunit J [Steroidobacteraceae bacterium]